MTGEGDVETTFCVFFCRDILTFSFSKVGKNTKGGFNVPLSRPQEIRRKLKVVAGEGWGEGRPNIKNPK